MEPDAAVPSAGLAARLRALKEQYAAKGLKYMAVSAFNVVFGQGLLFAFQAVGLEPTTANMLAVSISAVPAYLLSRYWVWQKTDEHRFLTEVVPFWGLAFLGFVLSTLAVSWVSDAYDGDPPKLIVNITNLTAFGIIWVGKFFILDKLLFKSGGHVPHTAEELALLEQAGDEPQG